MSFYIQLASLSIIILYVLLLFRNVDPLVVTAVCVGLGFLWNISTPIDIGNAMADALGSFMALVGFIIMLGRGLGEVLTHTQVSHTLVHQIVYGVGVNTQRRAKIGIVLSSFIIVGLLGTLAGGLAILAPSLRPIAGSVGLSRPSLAVLMQASAEEALILGPFAPPGCDLAWRHWIKLWDSISLRFSSNCCSDFNYHLVYGFTITKTIHQ